jgi:hypothetical protein
MARPIRRRRRRRRTIARRRFLAGIGFLALVVAATVALSLAGRIGGTFEDVDVPIAVLDRAEGTPADVALPRAAQRAVFPYSVIPGGVRTVDELRRAIATDAVVANHYKDFDLPKARVERLPVPRFAHVSYRLGDRVYWTQRPVLLPAGETVITDGTRTARTRCGNQVANEPSETSPAEPAAAVLDTPLSSRPLSSTSLLPRPMPGSGVMPAAGAVASGGAGFSGGGPWTGSGGISGSGPGGFVGSGGGGGGSSASAAPQAAGASVEPCQAVSGPCSSDLPAPGHGDVPGDSPGDAPGDRPGDRPGDKPEPPVFAGSPPPLGLTPPVNIPPVTSDHPSGPPNPPGDDGPQIPGLPPGDNPFSPPHDTPLGPPGPGIDSVPPTGDVPATIPEPGSTLLMLTAAGGLIVRRLNGRRRG